MMTNLIQTMNKLPRAWRFALGTYALLRLVYTLLSWAIIQYHPLILGRVELVGQPLLTVFDLRSSARLVYDPRVDASALRFSPAGREHFRDLQTGSLWDAKTGVAIQGAFEGERLKGMHEHAEEIFPYFGLRPHPVPMLAIWQRFDANWYVSIAERGYGAIPNDIHFPLLYPLFIRLLSIVVGDGFFAGLLLSAAACIAAFAMILDLFAEWGDQSLAVRGTAYMAIFPASFFLFSAYPEALFIVAAILALRAMRAGEWIKSGFWIACCILLRLQGVALLVPLLYRLLASKKSERWAERTGAVMLPAVAIAAYLFLRWHVAADPIPWVESGLHARMTFPWQNFIFAFQTIFSDAFSYIDITNLVCSILFLTMIILGWKHIPIEYSLFMAATFLILTARFVETQPLNSMIRYVLTLFPAFFTLARAGRNRIMNRLIVYSSFALNVFLCVQFWMWGWVG